MHTYTVAINRRHAPGDWRLEPIDRMGNVISDPIPMPLLEAQQVARARHALVAQIVADGDPAPDDTPVIRVRRPESDLSPTAIRMLTLLESAPDGITYTDLLDRLGVATSTLAEAYHRLSAAGLVEKVRNGHFVTYMTTKGAK